jgi:hypothetical protein
MRKSAANLQKFARCVSDCERPGRDRQVPSFGRASKPIHAAREKMNPTIQNMHLLLQEIAELLQSPTKRNKTAAVAKLERLVAIASTLSFTIQAERR